MLSIVMSPPPGERLLRHVGDVLRFAVATQPAVDPAHGWQARLRTTLGRGRAARTAIIQAHTGRVPPFGTAWHDIPLRWSGADWWCEIPLAEPGYFSAKAYLLDEHGYQHWPPGPDLGISVHPEWCRSANLIYCAFVRLFGEFRFAHCLFPQPEEAQVEQLEKQKYAVLPPSGTFRDLRRELPHIVRHLGFRILHLLPVHPTPTTYARFGRLGSPYAALDLTAVDPALVEFDRRTSGLDQFCELTQAAHDLDARVFLDIVMNHTGWGSRLFEEHPEFFRREPDGRFACPGAWGVVWEDLVELEQEDVRLWDQLAEALLTWRRRGVDGFRCDAGYKLPLRVWQYLIARVRSVYPDTVFLLEGLGGSWDVTEELLTAGGMQWAYSELFQNYSGAEVQSYLDYALRQAERVGTYVHYSETHDNLRLAARGSAWSLLRNRLCALTSVRGGFGITCGVEWLATEKIRVHDRTGLAWDNPVHLLKELATLNRLLADHPAFFDQARLRRLSPAGAPVYALDRISVDGQWRALVLINTRLEEPSRLTLAREEIISEADWRFELLGQDLPVWVADGHSVTIEMPRGAVFCLSPRSAPPVGFGELYRRRNAQVAWALQQAATMAPAERLVANTGDNVLSNAVAADPAKFLAALSQVVRDTTLASDFQLASDLVLDRCLTSDPFPNVILWSPEDAPRITLVPPEWWLLIRDRQGFRAHLEDLASQGVEYAAAVGISDESYIACFPPRQPAITHDARLVHERFSGERRHVEATFRFLAQGLPRQLPPDLNGSVLLTNGRGGMARLRVDFGGIQSKYDCALGANLDPEMPVDRHVFVKRVRAWLNADGFISPLDRNNLEAFTGGSPATWTFSAGAGDGRTATITVHAMMIPGRNTTLFRFARSSRDHALKASLTLRVDLEDRSYHAETTRNPGADFHFSTHCHTLADPVGFDFLPANDRRMRASVDRGVFHPQPEWSERIPHPFEGTRGQVAHGDAYSPGWFEIALDPGDEVLLSLDAGPDFLSSAEAAAAFVGSTSTTPSADPSTESDLSPAPVPANWFERTLRHATEAFIVRREPGHTIIAGYPWFLDWGRDTLIAGRGILASGRADVVLGILDTFGRFAERGTLPNLLNGRDASNRDTSDAPLWYAVLTSEAVDRLGPEILRQRVTPEGPTRLEVVRSLAEGYLAGTPNGILVDSASALVWSPSHFTWMDTNHPAGTPREGYPIEIQALWIQTLRFLARHDTPNSARWSALAHKATVAMDTLYWDEAQGWYGDVLLASRGTDAASALRDPVLRCNCLLPIAFGLLPLPHARRTVSASMRHLLIPGAMRTLAPLPTEVPHPVRGRDGHLLNDPCNPYWGRYEGDEDTRRKPSYHNGTAWVWFLPIFAEALAAAWPDEPVALRTARAILGSTEHLLQHGCQGQLPEIVDGDAPHTQRGCDAQAWSATEVLRVWLDLERQIESE